MEAIQVIMEKVKADLQEGKSDEEIFQTTLHSIGKDRSIDLQVAEQLASIPRVEVVRILHRMLRVSKEKTVRRVIKRSLYRLKNKGIPVETVLLEKESSVLRPLQNDSPKGYGGGFDTLGQRFLFLAIPRRSQGWTVMQGVISDTQGLVDFSGEEMSRKGFREFFEKVQEKSLFPLVEMEPSYVGFLFSSAYHLTLEKKRDLPQDYPSLKNEIEGIKKEYKKPLIYSLLRSDEIAGDDGILRRGGELLNADVINTWMIEEGQIQPYADEIREAEESKIILAQAQKEARFQGIFQKALAELFTREKRSLYQRRLEEMAYLFFKLGKEEEAKISLAVALELEKPESPFRPNPFLLQLVIQSIFILLKETYDQKGKEPSLIVKP